MWLSWNQSAVLALAVGVFALAAERSRNRWAPIVVATARELVLVLSVYTLWRIVKLTADRKTAEALRHARWIWHVEQTLHLPSELTLQRGVIPHSLLTQACNIFYATVHVPAVIAVLIWLFFRHREHYRWVRNNLAVLTAGCVLIQFIPVAPPRMFPDLGFIDTGLRYGQSVFGPGGSGESNQLAAMPSIHVGWAVLVAVAVVVASRSRWRWLIILHPAATMYTVMVTGNHWWLDGVVSAAILAVSLAVFRAPEKQHRAHVDDGDEALGVGFVPDRPDATGAEVHANT
jgi:PAP2 superfamily protein